MGDRLKGKIAVVTGAASGVGKQDALLFAREGARVVLTDVNEEAGREVAAQIGDAALFVRHDITSETGWNDVFGAAQTTFGTPDVLVNNAAVLLLGNIEDTTLEQWQRVLRINAEGYFLGCRAAVKAMKEKGGSIVNMSSVAALGGLGMFCAYSASKGAVTAHDACDRRALQAAGLQGPLQHDSPGRHSHADDRAVLRRRRRNPRRAHAIGRSARVACVCRKTSRIWCCSLRPMNRALSTAASIGSTMRS